MGYKNDLNAIQALVLKENLRQLEELIGKSQTDRIFNEMANLGFDFSSESQSYFVHEVREALDAIFGSRVAALIMQRIEGSLEQKFTI